MTFTDYFFNMLLSCCSAFKNFTVVKFTTTTRKSQGKKIAMQNIGGIFDTTIGSPTLGICRRY